MLTNLILAASLATPEPAPLHFEPELGLYDTPEAACVQEAARLARRPQDVEGLAQYCLYRLHHASRGQTVVSRVDGSEIHDRGRPAAHRLVSRLIRAGIMNPNECAFHRGSGEVRHPKGCFGLAHNWPFKRPEMTPERREAWLSHPHADEEFGTQGRFDINANAYDTMRRAGYDTCWPLVWVQDYGVGAQVTLTREQRICDEALPRNRGRCTFEMIKEN